MNPKTKITLTVVLGLTWAGAVIVGGRVLLKYESLPGKIGAISDQWPAGSSLQRDNDRPTLVMAVHPQCPCTKASVGELAQIVARTQNKVRVLVLFCTPKNSADEWINTDLHRAVARIPGVAIVTDIDSAEAQRFGAETSGHTFLFDSSGRLLFNGGITASRGHSGDNAGESSIVSLIDNRAGKLARTFVFGCPIKNKTSEGAKCLK